MGWQDILKSYDLDEFIIKKNKQGSKKKKGEKDFTVDVPGGKLTVTQTARIGQLQADMKKWYETCNNTKLDDIGIVGEKGNTSLLAFILDLKIYYLLNNIVEIKLLLLEVITEPLGMKRKQVKRQFLRDGMI